MKAIFLNLVKACYQSPRHSCLVIAPYSPAECKFPALGAAKKIRLVCHGFQKNAAQVVFCNTANNLEDAAYFQDEAFFPDGVVGANLIPNIKPRILGRFLFILCAPVLGLLIGAVVKPRTLWVYNLGAGELLMGYFAGLFVRSRILEVEDLPFARNRGTGELKPILDHCVSAILKDTYHTYVLVSHQVRKSLKLSSNRQLVVPGIIADLKIKRFPFENKPLKVGYFGGFDPEKGCNIVIELLKTRSRNWSYTVCGGGGKYERDIEAALQLDLGDQLFVKQSDEAMERLQAECQVLLNPHRPLREMGFGVFPFKVSEYMNSGSIIITTDMGLPLKSLEELGLRIADWRADDFHNIISESLAHPEWINENVLLNRGALLRPLVNDQVVTTAAGVSVFHEDSIQII